MANKHIDELVKLISKLPVNDLVAIHDWYCNTDGNPDNYIYEMSRFNEMQEEHTPMETVESLSDTFSADDSFFWYGTNEKIFSFSEKEDAIKAPFESDFIYADWLLDTHTEVCVPVIDDFVRAVKDDAEAVDWEEISDKLHDMIDDKVNDIFYDLQTKLGIESGDISPMQLLRLEDLEDELAKIMLAVLQFEKEF